MVTAAAADDDDNVRPTDNDDLFLFFWLAAIIELNEYCVGIADIAVVCSSSHAVCYVFELRQGQVNSAVVM